MITTNSVLAIIAYFIAWSVLFTRFRAQLHHTRHISCVYFKIAWGLALLIHAFILYSPLLDGGTLSLGLTSAISHVFWLLSFLLFLTTFSYRLETLGLFVIPAVALSVAAAMGFSETGDSFNLQGGLGVHIFTSLLAYSVLLFATVQALLLAYQNRSLHKRQTGGLIRTLPALQDMEALLFHLIRLGVLLLTISLVSGFIYLEGFFRTGIAHKTLFSIIAWCIFAWLVFANYRYGWRGKKAVRWTLYGAGFLLLAYFGSKFVFEYILS